MRITATTVGLLLTATLLAACGDDDDKANNGRPSQESSSSASDSASPTPAADLGVLVERTDYTFNLPRGWVDSTKDQALAGPEDSYGSLATDADHLVTVDAEPDVSQELFDHGLADMIKNLKSFYASHGKKLPDTTWADETAIHVQGQGQKSGTRAQAFYLRHDDTAYIICVQTLGGQEQNEAAVEVLRSSWSWN
ncbi:MAG: hypothetical protein L0H93_04145 [Nocardioides sp.]|nr:hypothetical protein [Nocardioides sp.]